MKGTCNSKMLRPSREQGEDPGPGKQALPLVDINGDNRLDIYVCYSGSLPDEKRTNQLFINEKTSSNNVPLFREQAEVYGVASPAFSNQGYFFDYDRDGDLDMLLLNHNPKSLPVLNEAQTIEALKQDDPLRGIRLFQQHEGHFEDVTARAGISGSALSYGLGLGISDVNNDGWPDFYVSNDYTIPDYLYLNKQDGTFTDGLKEQMGHNSHFSMGNDVADINNDGWQDIITLDMLPEDNRRQKLLLTPDNYAKFDLNLRSGFHYQYMRNMLQLNNGNGTFSEIGQLAGISNTDWSWAALLADYDNDGWKDLFITNGYYRDYTNLDFINYMNEYTQEKGRLQREDVLEIIGNMPASDVVNYVYENEGGKRFVNQTPHWGLNIPSNSNGAAYADLDNDGDLDLVVNNINQPAFIFRNDATTEEDSHYLQLQLEGEGLNTQGIGTKVILRSGEMIQSVEQVSSRGYLSAVSPILHVGLGEILTVESLEVLWPTGKRQVLTNVASDQRITLKEAEATREDIELGPKTPLPHFSPKPAPINFTHASVTENDFDRQPLLISGLSYEGPCMTQGDVNNDGRWDVYVGGGKGQSGKLFIQTNAGSFRPQPVPIFDEHKASVDTDAVFLDANQDGYLDLYVASGGYHDFQANDPRLQDRLYINDGQGNYQGNEASLPEMYTSTGCVAVHDINGDGHADVFIGGRVIPGSYPEIPRSYLLINDGKGNFIDQTQSLAPTLAEWGMITDAAWVDLDKNGTSELVLVGEWLPVSVFQQSGEQWTNATPTFFDQSYSGWWNTLEITDLNQDGYPDILAGNMGTNTQFQVSDTEPAELYFKDFDENGAIDPVFCYYIQGKSYPYLTRDELLRQFAGLRSRFTSYESFADMTLSDIFSHQQLEEAGHLKANHMETTFFLSQEGRKFELASLPVEAQYAPVFAMMVIDRDNDSQKDVLLLGNNSHHKLRLGKSDANYGILLRGDGKGNFEYLPQWKSGLALRGDVRSTLRWENQIWVGLNQGKIAAYQLNTRK